MKHLKNVVLVIALCGCVWSCSSYECGYSQAVKDCTQEVNELKRLVEKFHELDSLSWEVVVNNGLLDKDGSDTMSDYLRKSNEIDHLYKFDE
jgi:hypothetical protein